MTITRQQAIGAYVEIPLYEYCIRKLVMMTIVIYNMDQCLIINIKFIMAGCITRSRIGLCLQGKTVG